VAGARIQVLYGYAANGVGRPLSAITDESPQFGWRLIGGNNRELARGAQSYVTYAQVGEAVQLLRVGLAGLDWPINNDARTGKWHWHAESAGTPVMTGGRPYERERDCRDCIQHVRIALVDALITPGVTVVRSNNGTRTTRPTVHRNQHRPIPQDAP
jgi:hypothetical protein